MATNPLAPAMEPTPAPVPQPGLFDGQLPHPINTTYWIYYSRADTQVSIV